LRTYIFNTIFFKPYLVLCIFTKFWGMGQHHVLGWWKHNRSTIAKVLTMKQHTIIWANFFELTIFTTVPSNQYHQTSTMPPSSTTTPTRNSGSGYTTSTIHQSLFGGVNQWGSLIVAPTFTPSPYISLQVVTSTPIYTMEVSSSSGRIEKFSGRPCTFL
jgi:hypothetical protein